MELTDEQREHVISATETVILHGGHDWKNVVDTLRALLAAQPADETMVYYGGSKESQPVSFDVDPARHANCPAPADETEAAEREHLGCAHCSTGIYATAEPAPYSPPIPAEPAALAEARAIGLLREALAWIRGSGEPAVSLCADIEKLLAAQPADTDASEAIRLLAMMCDGYENGQPCYEEPESGAGYIGNAFQISHEDFHAMCNLLNRSNAPRFDVRKDGLVVPEGSPAEDARASRQAVDDARKDAEYLGIGFHRQYPDGRCEYLPAQQVLIHRPARASRQSDCTRSHPHENMSADCEAKTVAAREMNASRQGVALSDGQCDGCGGDLGDAYCAGCLVDEPAKWLQSIKVDGYRTDNERCAAEILLKIANQPRASSSRAEVEQVVPEDRLNELFKARMTPYGMLVRALRIVAGATLMDMSNWLGIKPSKLSSMELGRVPVSYQDAVDASGFFCARGVRVTLHALEAAREATMLAAAEAPNAEKGEPQRVTEK